MATGFFLELHFERERSEPKINTEPDAILIENEVKPNTIDGKPYVNY